MALCLAVAISGFGASAAVACDLAPNAARLASDLGISVNTLRKNEGRPALARNALLDTAAQRHACWLSTNNSFSHTGSGGSTPKDRIKSAGYPARLSSENIAHGQVSSDIVVADWMRSKGHRDNLLRQNATDYGVGIALLAGRTLWVMVYASR
nr:CAP domain-containing protein [Maritimibacter sp. DP1N21-5]